MNKLNLKEIALILSGINKIKSMMIAHGITETIYTYDLSLKEIENLINKLEEYKKELESENN